jgi:caa(3)-type oxidase subunit IV
MSAFRRRALRLLLAWAALITLMLASLASAYVPLGAGNIAVGLTVATVKSLIVLTLYMGLVRAPALLRLVAATGFATLAILLALSRVDFATRAIAPAPMQQPQQLQRIGHGPAAPGRPLVPNPRTRPAR